MTQSDAERLAEIQKAAKEGWGYCGDDPDENEFLLDQVNILTQQLADVTAERDALAKRVEGCTTYINDLNKVWKSPWYKNQSMKVTVLDSILEALNPTPASGEVIAVWFSCGAASAVAAKKTIELYGHSHDVRVVNNPVAEEDPDNQRFLRDVEKWLGIEIETAINPKFPNCSAVEVWDKRRFMSSPSGAPCTFELKKEARRVWEEANKPDWHVLGFTYDEKRRHERFVTGERVNVLPVLIDQKITKRDCFSILAQAGITLPKAYRLGFPNANCIGCVKATSPTYWNHVRNVYPDIFSARAAQSREIGARLSRYKGDRIFLDELPENATGRPMTDYHIECGIFCEETTQGGEVS